MSDDTFHEDTFEPIETEEPIDDKVEEPTEPQEPVETPEAPEEELKDVDNPKSYKHFQKIAEQRLQENARERLLREQAEAKLKEYEERLAKPEIPKAVLTQPTKPVKPQNFNDVEALTDPSSASWSWRIANEQYKEDMIEYQANVLNNVSTKFEQTEKEKQQAQHYQAHKQHWMGELVKAGGTPDEAANAYAEYIKGGTVTGENILALWRIKQGTFKPKPSVKTKEKFEPPLPPGVESGGEHEPLKSPDDKFNANLVLNNKYIL